MKLSHTRHEMGDAANTVVFEITGCEVRGLSQENQGLALKAYQGLCEPAPHRTIENLLAALHAATAHRNEDGSGLALILDLYSAGLARYPAFVVREVVLGFAKRPCKPNWWPSLGELIAECDALAAEPMAILEALHRPSRPLLPPSEPAEPDPARELRLKALELRRKAGPGQYVGERKRLYLEAVALEREARDLELASAKRRG